MSNSLYLKVFRFNPNTDAKPYFIDVNIEVSSDALLRNLLNSVKSYVADFSFSDNEFLGVKVNGVITLPSTPIREILEKFNTKNLVIEPISSSYVVTDLIVDRSSFDEKLNLLSAFVKDEDITAYNELISYYFASVSLEFEKRYYGDSLFMFAFNLIRKYPEHKKAILEKIADRNYGIWLHLSLKNIIFDSFFVNEIDDKIDKLKREIISEVPKVNRVVKREVVRSARFYV